MDYYKLIEFIGDNAELVAILIIVLLLIVVIRILTELILWIANQCKRKSRHAPEADPAAMPIPETPGEPYQPCKRTQRERVEAYIRLFLSPGEKTTIRKSVYINHAFHEKIKLLVRVAGKTNLTAGSYVDTILTKHFEQYGEEVKAICSKQVNKIL